MLKAKETASNIVASAQSGMDKTKATVQEKVERMKTQDPMEKEMATEKKQEKINHAEWNKQGLRENNAAARHASSAGTGTGTGTGTETGTYTHSTTGAQPMGGHPVSTLPGRGDGQPTDHMTEDMVGSHPNGGIHTGTGRITVADNSGLGGVDDPNTGHGTGGAYN